MVDKRFTPRKFRFKRLYLCTDCFMLYTVKWLTVSKVNEFKRCQVCLNKIADIMVSQVELLKNPR
ncbi:MAG: hypothetical protein QW160_03715 [Candidatus Bathyarchaeia archaeon]